MLRTAKTSLYINPSTPKQFKHAFKVDPQKVAKEVTSDKALSSKVPYDQQLKIVDPTVSIAKINS